MPSSAGILTEDELQRMRLSPAYSFPSDLTWLTSGQLSAFENQSAIVDATDDPDVTDTPKRDTVRSNVDPGTNPRST
jgi:hypothetical protein